MSEYGHSIRCGPGGDPARANTLLLVGGDLCVRAAGALDPQDWTCAGLRRRAMDAPAGARIRWLRADLGAPEALANALGGAAAPDLLSPPGPSPPGPGAGAPPRPLAPPPLRAP